MAGRRTNVALLLLLAAAFATGAAAYAVGTESNKWVTISHGVVGLALVALAPWKSLIARRGLRRRRPGFRLSVLLGAAVAISIAFGIAHAAGVRSAGALTA